MNLSHRHGIILALTLLGLLSHGPPIGADEPRDRPGSNPLRKLLERMGRLGRQLDAFHVDRRRPIPENEEDRTVRVTLRTPHLGTAYDRTRNRTRFFAARLTLVNLTEQPFELRPRKDVTLSARGKTFRFEPVPPRLGRQAVRLGDRTEQIRELAPEQELAVPSGATRTTGVLFFGLPARRRIPKLVLKVSLGETTKSLDVNATARDALKLQVERIGPRDSLGLLTISGTLNTVNVGDLVEELDRLTDRKVRRAVIRWTDSAQPVSPALLQWLKEAAARGGENREERFPALPAGLRELHLAGVPQKESAVRTSDGGRHVHRTDREAVAAALRSAYRILPPEELLTEIQQGHPLCRGAALSIGGGRLPAANLPLLLDYADHDDPVLQQAALTALRHFGETAAVEKLLHYARRNIEPLTETAIESLAASRYAAAHRALLDLLDEEPAASKRRIVAILARCPRPIWSETIHEFAADVHSDVAPEALRALAEVGHPELLELLERALKTGDEQLQQTAFELLVARSDRHSEELALRYTLRHLQDAPPTSAMHALLDRTRDRRAVPLLLEHLEQATGHRPAVLRTLLKLGGRAVAEPLVEQYPRLTHREQAIVLKGLQDLRSPDFRRLAGEALRTKDSTLIRAACRGLQEDGGQEAVRLLVEAWEQTEYAPAWAYISNTLAVLATPQARSALQTARASDNDNKRNYAVNALRNLRRRSPGFPHVRQARRAVQQEDWDEAIRKYDLAVKLDPALPEAYAGRGHVRLRQGQTAEAKEDFARAVDLDPYNALAVTGMGICLVEEGDPEKGIQFVEEARERFPEDDLFAYNTACVYGKALALNQGKEEETDESDAEASRYRQKALAELKRAVELGFRDFEWMRDDPDLKPLHDLPEFEQIASPGSDE